LKHLLANTRLDSQRRYRFFSMTTIAYLGITLVLLTLTQAATYADSGNKQVAVSQAGSRIGPTNQQQELNLAIALKPQSQAELDQFVVDLYDPQSPNYKHYLTPQEYTNRFFSSATRAELVSFLKSNGLKVTDSGVGSTVNASGSVATIENAFQVHISDYSEATTGRVYYSNAVTPLLPTQLAPYIQNVAGLENYIQYHPNYIQAPPKPESGAVEPASNPGTPSGCAGAVNAANLYGSYTPNQLKTAYNFDPFYASGINGSGQTAAVFELSNYVDTNVATYQSCFGTAVPVNRVAVDGGNSSLNGQVEVELDIEVLIGMNPGLNQVLVYESPNTGNGIIDQYQQIANQNLAKVVSVSWGLCEAAANATFLNAENTIYQQMAAQGQSIFIASGDDGSQGCLRSNGSKSLAVSDGSDSPYATGVGGTRLVLNTNNTITSEITWNDSSGSHGSGGGGISTYYAKPSYQVGTGTNNTYSNGKRQIPDVSAASSPYTGYVIYSTGSWFGVGGTSAAAPFWASAAVLVNQYLSTLGGGPLGFANPTIYRIFNSTAASSVYRDITAGDNCYDPGGTPSCGTPNSGTGVYPATTGYDQATGIGSLNAYNFALNAQLPSTVILSSLLNPSVLGQSVIFTAAVSGSGSMPTGTVTFKEGATTLGTGNLDASGVATYSTTSLSSGTHSITAVYAGNGVYKGSTSEVLTQRVLLPSTTALSSSVNPSQVNQSVTLTATISGSGGTATGSVTFKEGATTLGSSNLDGTGVATYNVTFNIYGTHSITAVYNGDNVYTNSTSQVLSQMVLPPSNVSLTSSANPASFGQTVTFTSNVTSPAGGTPTGTVTFKDNTTTLGSSSLNGAGVATFSTNTLSSGNHSITASYGGDANYGSATSPSLNQVIQSGCTPVEVTTGADDGTPGSFRKAVEAASTTGANCKIVDLTSPNIGPTITLTQAQGGGVTVGAGVTLLGPVCSANGPTLTINGTGVTGDGLILNGATVQGLAIKGFGGRQIVAKAGNSLFCVKTSKT
jgi:subtilase family serine protease